MYRTQSLALFDPEINNTIVSELERIETTIDLIASENYASPAVMEAMGSIMTNKYAEGYPGKRYYGGCQFVDQAEVLAKSRLLKLFNLNPELYHANVQPHAGATANMAAFFAILKPGDTILGMDLAAGGHLTHGYKINFSGIFYKPVHYGVNPQTGILNYNEIAQLAHEHKPKLIIAGASAYSRTIDFAKFKDIADQVGALLMVDMAHIAGLIAAGLHPSPFEYADIVTSTTHKTLRGPRGGLIICKKQFDKQIDRAVMPGIQGGPLMHQITAKAVAFKEAIEPSFKLYQQQVIKNAHTMAHELQQRGYTIVSGGTDNHLMTIDLRSKNITGKAAEEFLEKTGISLNKNCIPADPQSPLVTSGIRVGTPAITTRGFKEAEIKIVVDLLDRALSHHTNEQALLTIAHEITTLCRKFPVYSNYK